MVQIKVGRGNPPLVEPSASAQSDDLIKSAQRCILWLQGIFSGNGLDSANEGQIASCPGWPWVACLAKKSSITKWQRGID